MAKKKIQPKSVGKKVAKQAGEKHGKKRRVWLVVIIFLAFVVVGGAVGGVIAWRHDKNSANSGGGALIQGEQVKPGDKQEPGITENPDNPIVTYSIVYRAIENGKEKDIYAPLFAEGGNYPTTYTPGADLNVSPLNGAVTVTQVEWEGWEGTKVVTGAFTDPQDSNTDYEFYGWYTDVACTQSFDGSLETTGTQTLYAKIVKGTWIGGY